MADSKKSTPAKSDAPKRKQLTADERIAKLEADLQAARDKAAAKQAKERGSLEEKKQSLVERRNKLNEQIAEIDAKLGPDTDGFPDHVTASDIADVDGKNGSTD